MIFIGSLGRGVALSVTFLGFILALVSFGIVILKKKTGKVSMNEIVIMSALMFFWGFYALLRNLVIEHSFEFYMMNIFGLIIVIIWLFMLKKMWKVFDKKLLIFAGIFALIPVLLRFICTFIPDEQIHLIIHFISDFCVGIPPVLGLVMIIKHFIKYEK